MIINSHINDHLNSFLKSCDEEKFENLFTRLKSNNKSELKIVLRYLYCIIENSGSQENKLHTFHVHFEKIINENSKTLISEFLWHYYFDKHHSIEAQNKKVNLALEKRIKSLEKKINNGTNYPYEDPLASRQEKNKIRANIRELRESFKINKKHLNYYKALDRSASLTPETLINLKVNQEASLNAHFNYDPTYLSADKDELSDLNSYVLYNTKGFNEIKRLQVNNTPLLKLIENVILFDCENSIQRFSGFNFAQLTNLNENFGTNFKTLLIITFAKKECLVSINAKINELKERYFIPDKSTYVITNQEFDLLLNQKNNFKPDIKFIGLINSVFWDDFSLEVKINGLYELRSFKLMNIYSLCFNKEIKDFILKNIFSSDVENHLITKETYRDICSLPEEEINNIKNLLSSVLDIIINANILSEIDNYLIDESKIVLDDFVFKNTELKTLIKKLIKVRSSSSFITWDVLENNTYSNIIILSYRDQGNFNYQFYPNIHEIKANETSSITGLFCALLFKKQFDWSNYNLANNYNLIHNHPIRRKHFELDKIKGKVEGLKPEKTIDISWDLESDYSNSDSRITYRIDYKNNRHSTCNPSDLHIFSVNNVRNKRIQTIRWVYDNVEIEEGTILIQNLHELIEEFNPAEKLVDTKQQENDLEIIRNQFDLSGESAGRLWKILLQRKATNSSVESVYKDLKSKFTSYNIDLVSKSHFENTWLNPGSTSLIPRGNKAFKVLCDYLGLPTSYLRIMYTIRNRNINGTRNATRIYSRLLKDIFNDGCFDDGVNPEEILLSKKNEYASNHNLDELGIDEEKPLKDLITLIDLIKPELSLRLVDSILRKEV